MEDDKRHFFSSALMKWLIIGLGKPDYFAGYVLAGLNGRLPRSALYQRLVGQLSEQFWRPPRQGNKYPAPPAAAPCSGRMAFPAAF